MPISVTSPPGTTIGPGVGINLRSDLVGPIGADWVWRLSVIRPVDEQNIVVLESPIWSVDDHQVHLVVEGDPLGLGQSTGYAQQVSANTNDTVILTVQLVDTLGAIHDSGALGEYRWDTSTSSSRLLVSTSGGGLTAEQAQQLTDTERRSQVLGEPGDLVVDQPSGLKIGTLAQLFSRTTLDKLTLDEVTSGPTCDPVRAQFSFYYYGVIVRVTTIDPLLVPKTPDLEWYFQDLAVLRIFRGADLQYRRGIHTPTFLTDHAWEWSWNIRNTLDWLGVPPDNTLAVDWRQGCCGQVFFLKWP